MDSDSDYNPKTFEKKINRQKSKQKRVRFSHDKKIRMIQLYKKHPCLWDTKHMDYWNRVERSKAEKEIADLLKYPEALVNIKWQVLRNEFRVERNKVLKSHGSADAYISKWPFYSHLQFLNNQSNRPYKLSKRQTVSRATDDPFNDVSDVNDDIVDEVRAIGTFDMLRNKFNSFIPLQTKYEHNKPNNGASNGINRETPISIDSNLSLIDDENGQPATAAAFTRQSSLPRYSNVCTYVAEKRARLPNTENVTQCLEIIDELSKKIRSVEQDDEVRVFGDFVTSQLKQIKSKLCRGRCVHEMQRALMDWQNKDEEFVNQLQPQQEWQVQEDNDLTANEVTMNGANAIDPLDGELTSLGLNG